ncbi:hypothetical protein BJY52DRAFT_1422843 [Lactarius psammicola]|nr:hypothetical protein BJY52DRAFT_1422843 [Lactarius psammicola]
MCWILLGLIVDLPLPSGEAPSRIIRTIHMLLDFLYLAQLPSHTTDTLLHLEESLARFHDNKEVFVDLGIREHFNIPKVHGLLHYKSSITLFGTTDNYNTEQTEQLHIDFTKDAYHATNHKDEYPQMTSWLEHHKKIQQHASFVTWQQRAQQENFQDALADFIAWINHPQASVMALKALAEDTLLPFRSVPVFHKIKFVSTCESEIVDSIHVWPDQRDARGRLIPSRFDTVIVDGGTQVGTHRNKGLRIAQVRLVFQLPSKVIPQVFPSSNITPPTHLAYVEWFSPIPTTSDSNNLLHRDTLEQNTFSIIGSKLVSGIGRLVSGYHSLAREVFPDGDVGLMNCSGRECPIAEVSNLRWMKRTLIKMQHVFVQEYYVGHKDEVFVALTTFGVEPLQDYCRLSHIRTYELGNGGLQVWFCSSNTGNQLLTTGQSRMSMIFCHRGGR